MSKVTNVNLNYKDTIDWKTLLTTIVENLHAVSHFKYEAFDALHYATDFGTMSKESSKRITGWGGGILNISVVNNARLAGNQSESSILSRDPR